MASDSCRTEIRRNAELRRLVGQQVTVCLTDGSRIDDCQLVSAGNGAVSTLWLFAGGTDTFVRLADVVDLWHVDPNEAKGRLRVSRRRKAPTHNRALALAGWIV
jgi:hypothetical protein